MNNAIQIQNIGVIRKSEREFYIELKKDYLEGLTKIDGFSHLQIIWWGHLYATPEYRSFLVGDKPYKTGPDKIGVFATRSPVRPNPILISTIHVSKLDIKNGRIYTPYIDAEQGTSVLDIKPYHPSERVRDCHVPDWCKHWPEWDKDTATFNWQNEFNF